MPSGKREERVGEEREKKGGAGGGGGRWGRGPRTSWLSLAA